MNRRYLTRMALLVLLAFPIVRGIVGSLPFPGALRDLGAFVASAQALSHGLDP